jgi:hypothetical protein
MLMPRIALLIVAFFFISASMHAKDYLTRGDALFDQSLPVFKRYDREVKRILHRAWERDVIVRAVHLPPFDPEWIVGIIRSRSGYRAFRFDASYFIWQALNDEKEKLPSITASTGSGRSTKCPLYESPLCGASFSPRHKTTEKTQLSTVTVRHFISSSERYHASTSPAGLHTCLSIIPKLRRFASSLTGCTSTRPASLAVSQSYRNK